VIELVRDEIGGPGRYEGLTAFQAWLCERVSGDESFADEVTGSVDTGGWFARIGRRVIQTDDRGFWYVYKYATEEEASAEIAYQEEEQYPEDEEEEEREEYPRCANQFCNRARRDPSAYCEVHAGGLIDELRAAERELGTA
jgi:hypothetical protein